MRPAAFRVLKQAVDAMDAQLAGRDNREWDLVLTAHSLGSAVCYLVLLDILHAGIGDGLDPLIPILPATTRITIATFGSPRVGNPPLVNHYRELVEEWRRTRGSVDALTEWPIIGHMDGVYSLSMQLKYVLGITFVGVPALPPAFLGYNHFSEYPYYSFGGHLYRIPSSDNEYTCFKVESLENEPVLFARGGHNYYGARDMERLQRRMKPIFTEMTHNFQNPRLGSRLRGRRSISDGANHFKNKRIEELPRPHEQRATSLPAEETESPSFTSPDSPDEAADLESSPDPDPSNVIMEPGVESYGESWIERYLAREREEEAIWIKRNKSSALWGVLRGVVAFGVFKKA